MKKLRLKLDDLRIDSFDTTAPQKAKGTVFGEQCTCYTQCTCPGCPTCYASCNGTCDATCNGTCAVRAMPHAEALATGVADARTRHRATARPVLRRRPRPGRECAWIAGRG